ncbi:hypothetical protein QFC20_007704 [Naganishia adeliensis]|uniref:Uncharacterized protein n=1 Tax=Naganishia adeliensis TaxID=92952 RepID=A0ACC2UWX8_9TREE|nr:hypothetical protein QFC20_007704 [Naganishia adeliensis]
MRPNNACTEFESFDETIVGNEEGLNMKQAQKRFRAGADEFLIVYQWSIARQTQEPEDSTMSFWAVVSRLDANGRPESANLTVQCWCQFDEYATPYTFYGPGIGLPVENVLLYMLPPYRSAPTTIGSSERSAESTYGGSFSLNLKELSIFSDSDIPSGPEANPGTVVKSTTVWVLGIAVKVRLTIACTPEAIHHEIEMDWTGQGPASTTPGSRHVHLAIDIDQVGSKYQGSMMSAQYDDEPLKTIRMGGETGEIFRILGKVKRMPAKEAIGHANRVVAKEWLPLLWKMDRFWETEPVLWDLDPIVKRWLWRNLTNVYVQNQ